LPSARPCWRLRSWARSCSPPRSGLSADSQRSYRASGRVCASTGRQPLRREFVQQLVPRRIRPRPLIRKEGKATRLDRSVTWSVGTNNKTNGPEADLANGSTAGRSGWLSGRRCLAGYVTELPLAAGYLRSGQAALGFALIVAAILATAAAIPITYGSVRKRS